MSGPIPTIRRLSSDEAEAQIPALADILLDCVAGGASVSFMWPMSRETALGFWRGVTADVARGGRVLLVAEDEAGVPLGTVQLLLSVPENQPHRAEIAKMLVHRRARRMGVGAALMRAAEAVAREHRRTILVLDTATGGEAERLYRRLGWVEVGVVPHYALMPDGASCPTTFFYRDLRA